MAVVPERARLADGREVVQERVERLDGTLRDERGAVRPSRSVLEDTVPVLPITALYDKPNAKSCWRRVVRTTVVELIMVSFVIWSTTLIWKLSPYM